MSASFAKRRGILRTALAGTAALVSGCSALGVVNAFVPADTYRRTGGLQYGAHERQRLDVYQPAKSMRTRAVVIFFYGGNWNAGRRGDYLFVGEALASQGLLSVIPDYRLYPQVRFPDFLIDCARATRWVQENIAGYGGDPTHIYLVGHSAGAYNAAMLALDPTYLTSAGADRRAIHGWVGLAGPYDFLPLTGEIARAVFGFPNTPLITQPITHVSSNDPPALLITGSDDSVVNRGNSSRLAARLRRHGVAAREIVYRGVGHSRLVGALASPLRRTAPLLEDIVAFVGA